MADEQALAAFRQLLTGKLKDAGVYTPDAPVQGPPAPVDRSYQGPYAPHFNIMDITKGEQQQGDISQVASSIPPVAYKPPDTVTADHKKLGPSRYEVYDDVETGKPLYIYSTTGKREVEQFDGAMDRYTKTGITPKGYAILPSDSFASGFRQMLEAVQGGSEQYAQKPLSTTTGGTSAEPKAPFPLNLVIQGVRQLAPAAASLADDPKKVGSLAGAIGTAMATKNLSPLLQVLGVAGGAATGYTAGGALGGESVPPGDIAAEFATNAIGGGAVHALRNVLGFGINQLAQNKVYSKLVKYMQDKFGSVAADPDKLTALLSTKKGFRDVVDMGIEAVTGSADDAATQFVQGLRQGLRQVTTSALKKSTATSVQQEMSKLTSVLVESLKTGDRSAIDNTAVGAVTKIAQMLDRDFAQLSPTAKQAMQQRVDGMIQQYIADTSRFIPAARTLRLLKEAGGETVNVQRLQQMLQGGGRAPGSLIYDLTDIAGRGGRGVDKGIYGPDIVGGVLRRFGLPVGRVSGPRLGTKYTGTLPGGLPAGATTGAMVSVTSSGIKSFLGEE